MLRARSDAIDLNEYTVTWLVRQRLREREAEAQRERAHRSRAADTTSSAATSRLWGCPRPPGLTPHA